ncbi:MAG: hypothetical protein J7K88_12785 [Candidatus Fermentibacteraceae bacterium]|nr:hypothetical protein [Candidatus Fermentibacteraceae bacterium]
MKFNDLLKITKNEPVFSSALLYAGLQSPDALRVQISRWVNDKKLLQLRRGLYAVSPDYSGQTPDLFIAANTIKTASYVSCQTALAWHGVIPDISNAVTSVTSGRSCTVSNALGTFIYRHVKPELLWGYESAKTPSTDVARIAVPEKALLDLVYLEPGGDSLPYLKQLRLSEDGLSLNILNNLAARWGRKKIIRAAENITTLLGAL